MLSHPLGPNLTNYAHSIHLKTKLRQRYKKNIIEPWYHSLSDLGLRAGGGMLRTGSPSRSEVGNVAEVGLLNWMGLSRDMIGLAGDTRVLSSSSGDIGSVACSRS